MKEPKKRTDAFSQRYQRYLPIIDYVTGEIEVDLKTTKAACHPENPAFVTRVVNELAKQGWLVREGPTAMFRWNRDKGVFQSNAWLDQKLFGTQIKAGPQNERPRERLLSVGATELSTSELIAILIRSGRPGESAVMAGQKIAKAFNNKLDRLPSAGRGELKSISTAVEKTAYCQIMAGIELGRRISASQNLKSPTKITGSDDAIKFCQGHFRRLITDAQHEEFHIVTLDTKNQVIDSHQITVGTLDASLVHPRKVFRAAIKDTASSILLAHNHPSGDPTPSREDIAVTDRLTEAGKIIGIDVLDHIVLAKQSCVSIRSST
jgi:DNA repair protein RadC